MDLTLDKVLPPVQAIQIIERPAADGGNNGEEKLLSLLKQFRQEIKNGGEGDSVRRKISQLLLVGSLKLVDDKESTKDDLLLIEVGLLAVNDAQFKKFSKIVHESVKKLENDELLKLIGDKENFNKEELINLISKMPAKEITRLKEEFLNLVGDDNDKNVLGLRKKKSKNIRVRSSLPKHEFGGGPGQQEIRIEGRSWPKAAAKRPHYSIESWQSEFVVRLNCLDQKKRVEACKLVYAFVGKHIQQEQKELYEGITKNYSKDSPAGAVRFIELLPKKTAIQVLAELESKFFSHKNTQFYAAYKKDYDELKYSPMQKIYLDRKRFLSGIDSKGILLREVKDRINALSNLELLKFQKKIFESVERSQNQELIKFIKSKETFGKKELVEIIGKLSLEEQMKLSIEITLQLFPPPKPPYVAHEEGDLVISFISNKNSFYDNLEYKLKSVPVQKRNEIYGYVKNSVKRYIGREIRQKNASRSYVNGLKRDYRRITKAKVSGYKKLYSLLNMLPSRIVTKVLDKIEAKYFASKNLKTDSGAPMNTSDPLSKVYKERKPIFINLGNKLNSLGVGLSVHDQVKLDEYSAILNEILSAKEDLQRAQEFLVMHYFLDGNKKNVSNEVKNLAKEIKDIRLKIKNLKTDPHNVNKATAVYGLYEKIIQKLINSDVFLIQNPKIKDKLTKQLVKIITKSKSDEDIKARLYYLYGKEGPDSMKSVRSFNTFLEKLFAISKDMRTLYQAFTY